MLTTFYDWIDSGWISNHVAFSATAEITYLVSVGPAPEISAPENIVCAGDTIQCSVSGGTSPYFWSSSDETIASVDANGLVTTLTNGTVTITVSDYYGCDDSLEINAVRVQSITAESTVADNSPQEFEGATTDFGDPCSKSPYPELVGQSLIVYYDEVADDDDNIADFDIDLTATLSPNIEEDEVSATWTKTSGPDSGSFDQTTGFDVKFQNPQNGGIYEFEFNSGLDGCAPSKAIVLLPLAGAESSDFIEDEFQRLSDWVDDQTPNIPVVSNVFAGLLLMKIAKASKNLDYAPGDWEGGNSPCGRFSVYDTSETLTVDGVVMSSFKVANMMWGTMMERLQYWEWFTRLGADVFERLENYTQYGASGLLSGDTSAAQSSYNLGRDLVQDGVDTLYDKIREYRDAIREPDAVEPHLWPSTDTLTSHPGVPDLPP